MSKRLFLNKEVSIITGLTQRQILSWTERGLVEPEKPAKKAGTRRGYSYLNLLEFGLAKYLLDVIGLQFYTAKKILAELREDGEIGVWASNVSSYRLSCASRIKDEEKEDLVTSQFDVRVHDPHGLGGTVDYGSDKKRLKDKRPKIRNATLYYIFTSYGKEKSYQETIRVVSPTNLQSTQEVFSKLEPEDVATSRAVIAVNLGQIKEEIDKSLNKI